MLMCVVNWNRRNERSSSTGVDQLSNSCVTGAFATSNVLLRNQPYRHLSAGTLISGLLRGQQFLARHMKACAPQEPVASTLGDSLVVIVGLVGKLKPSAVEALTQ